MTKVADNQESAAHLVEPDRRYKNGHREVTVVSKEVPLWKARLATVLIERWGLVAGRPDGEDSSGRSRIRPYTATELVEAACNAADLAVDEFRKRGWTMELPDPYAAEE